MYVSPHGETDDEADYENADTIFQQKNDSDNSDDDYDDVDAEEQSDVDHDYESVDDYENCGDNYLMSTIQKQ